jgi:T-complex protein 1 subunit alpha
VGNVQWGLDLLTGTPCNSLKNGVVEPTMNKVKMLSFATEAALTILRIDDLIKVEPDPAEEEQ